MKICSLERKIFFHRKLDTFVQQLSSWDVDFQPFIALGKVLGKVMNGT